MGVVPFSRREKELIMKKNLNTPTNIVGKRRHGFRERMSTEHGRNVIKRRRLAGRHKLTI